MFAVGRHRGDVVVIPGSMDDPEGNVGFDQSGAGSNTGTSGEARSMKAGMVRVEGELTSCPKCGADRGFHVAFRRVERMFEAVMVCPSCGFRFTVGDFLIPDGEPRPHDPSIDSGP